jgi:hypothetical protein
MASFCHARVILARMKRTAMKAWLLWVTFLSGVLGGTTALAQASNHASIATAPAIVHVPAHIYSSAPVAITVDLRDHPFGSPILACPWTSTAAP